jgi:hypothetical protein
MNIVVLYIISVNYPYNCLKINSKSFIIFVYIKFPIKFRKNNSISLSNLNNYRKIYINKLAFNQY